MNQDWKDLSAEDKEPYEERAYKLNREMKQLEEVQDKEDPSVEGKGLGEEEKEQELKEEEEKEEEKEEALKDEEEKEQELKEEEEKEEELEEEKKSGEEWDVCSRSLMSNNLLLVHFATSCCVLVLETAELSFEFFCKATALDHEYVQRLTVRDSCFMFLWM